MRASRILLIVKGAAPEGQRRLAEVAAKKRAERARALEPAFEADFRDAAIGGCQQAARALKAIAREEAVRGEAEGAQKTAMEMIRRKAGGACGGLEGSFAGKRGEKKVAAAEDAAEKFAASGGACRREPLAAGASGVVLLDEQTGDGEEDVVEIGGAGFGTGVCNSPGEAGEGGGHGCVRRFDAFLKAEAGGGVPGAGSEQAVEGRSLRAERGLDEAALEE